MRSDCTEPCWLCWDCGCPGEVSLSSEAAGDVLMALVVVSGPVLALRSLDPPEQMGVPLQ